MSRDLEQLTEAAKTVCKKAYAPYSKFPVGCAVLSESGEVYTGCNVENISFGLTMCAERSAIYKAVSKEGTSFRVKHVVLYTPTNVPITPCGACRQVLREFGDDFEILSLCDLKDIKSENINFYLPNSPDIKI